jgi:hypothetical protein
LHLPTIDATEEAPPTTSVVAACADGAKARTTAETIAVAVASERDSFM